MDGTKGSMGSVSYTHLDVYKRQDFRIGIDVMTTETTCLSSIWKTDETIREFYETHGRSEEYKELNPGAAAYYLSLIHILPTMQEKRLIKLADIMRFPKSL